MFDLENNFSDTVLFDRAQNVQLACKQLKLQLTKLIETHVVEQTMSLLFYGFSGIPIVNQTIAAYKTIYILFCFYIYHKPHFIFKSKPQYFHNRNIELFSENDTILAGHVTEIHRDLRMQKSS